MTPHREAWLATARQSQLPPEGEWRTWLLLTGRGFGKTRAAAEDCAWYALTHPGHRIGVVAPTFADGRDICVEGESGLLAAIPHANIENWNRSIGELILTNDARFRLFAAEQPNRLRGPQHHRIWAEEVASWNYLEETWDMCQFGLRLGSDPRTIATTTPKPRRFLKALIAKPEVMVTTGSTFENEANLPPAYIESLQRRYEGTPLGRQEIYAEVLDETEDTLIPGDKITAARKRTLEPGRPVQLSCDVARFGKDETVVMLIRGQVAEYAHLSHQADTMATAGQLARLRREHDASLIRVDAIGVGGGVVDRLAEIGEPVLGLDAGASPSDPRFLNCRAEWYWLLRERFERGDISIPDDDELDAQLGELRYEYTSRGKIKIESKDDMAKRGLPSPDRADALMMGFATDAVPPAETEYVVELPHRKRYQISPF